MIKILEDLLIEATTTPNVPGSLVAGLRKAVDVARCGSVKGKTFAFSGVLPTLSRDDACARLEAAGGVIVSAVSANLDYLVAGSEAGSKLLKALELGVPVIGEKQLQAMLQATAEPVPSVYHVCLKTAAHGHQVGAVVQGRLVPCLAEYWAPCDKDGWVSAPVAPHVRVEWHEGAGTPRWRPLPPTPSAIDEMAEQMKRWAAPTREGFDKAIDGLSEAMGVAEHMPTPALAVQEGGSHYKDMKIQPVEYIHANGLGYFEGNVVKYVSRWRAKGGLQDLKKARHYLDILIELEGVSR